MVARSAVAVLVAAILVVGSSCDASVTPCGVGVCAVDLLWRRVSTGGKWDPEGVNATRNMMKDAVSNGFTYARMAGSPFWPVDLQLWYNQSTRAHYWAIFDTLMDDVGQAGLKVGITIMWNHWAVIDVCHEHMSQLIPPNASSCSVQLLKTYTTELVGRYHKHRALLYWELTNELNNNVDLDQSNSTAGCAPSLGTPTHRTRADNFSTPSMVTFMNTMKGWIRSVDPHSPVSTGHSIPRPAAYHLYKSYYQPQRDWTPDSISEFGEMLRMGAAKCELASAHIYNPHNVRWNISDPNDPSIVGIAANALKGSGTELYVGEYGQTGAKDPKRTYTNNMLQEFVRVSQRMSTLWVWEMKGQESTFSVGPTKTPQLVKNMKATNEQMHASVCR